MAVATYVLRFVSQWTDIRVQNRAMAMAMAEGIGADAVPLNHRLAHSVCGKLKFKDKDKERGWLRSRRAVSERCNDVQSVIFVLFCSSLFVIIRVHFLSEIVPSMCSCLFQ